MYSFSCLEIVSSIPSITHQVEFEFLLTLRIVRLEMPYDGNRNEKSWCKTFLIGSGLLVDMLSHDHRTLLEASKLRTIQML